MKMNVEDIKKLVDGAIDGKPNEECIEILEEIINYSESLLESFD